MEMSQVCNNLAEIAALITVQYAAQRRGRAPLPRTFLGTET
jgi:hypothetical protein